MANNINCTCGHSWSKASSSGKDMYVCHICGKDNTMKDGGWLNKYEQGGMVLKKKTKDNYDLKVNPNDVKASVGPGFVGLGYDTTGRNYSPAWGGQFAMGGSLPGAVGFTYARVAGSAPANGKYTKKTKASAQNGTEMSFYQNGLDFKPKSISKNGSVIKDDRGQWAYPGEITEIGSNEITMQGVDYPVLGISDTGDTQMMYPDQDYKFDGDKVTEYPMAQDGKVISDNTRVKKPITTSSIVDSKKQTLQKYAREMAQKEQPTLSTWNPLTKDEIRKQLYEEAESNKLKNKLLQAADVATDLMQIGNFVPNPVGQSIGKVGNVIGGWLDAYQAANAFDEGNYEDAAINLASVALPMALGANTFRRNSKYLQPGQPLNFLKGSKRVNYIEPFTNVRGMTNKNLMVNRALLGTLGAETVYDSKQNGGWLNKYK
jgi:hypothetical protein